MYSAIKQGGRKLYELARAGETVERPARNVRIDVLNLSNWQSPEFDLEVMCSAGTYIRSLAHDLGEVLGIGAHLSSLCRLASGTFTLDSAVSLDDLLADPNWQDYLIAPADALAHWPSLYLNADEIEHIQHGRAVACDEAPPGQVFAYGTDGRLIAVVTVEDGLIFPHKVFS